jgi:hypothetical protein
VQTITTSAESAAVAAGQPHGRSAASWGAIFAGALVAIATSLILVTLGAGLGFAAASPWQGQGITATTFTVTTAIWLIVVQWISACLGGYLAGRLRTRWLGTHVHEVFFRDTANGLVTWALATVVVAALVAGSLGSLVSGGVHAASAVAAGGAQGMAAAAPSMASNYDVDKLFRSSRDTGGGGMDPKAQVAPIVANAVTTGSVPAADRTYLAGLVADKTGATPEEAQRRVDEFVSTVTDAQVKAKQAADTARKAAAQAAIYTALSLLVGAFIASVSAALGGRLRDEHP